MPQLDPAQDFEDDGGTPMRRRRQSVTLYEARRDASARAVADANERDRRFMAFIIRIVLAAFVLLLVALGLFLGQAFLDAIIPARLFG